MTILQAQTDLANIAMAIDKENEIAVDDKNAILAVINALRQTLDSLESTVVERYAAHSSALNALIGAPPVEFKQAAE